MSYMYGLCPQDDEDDDDDDDSDEDDTAELLAELQKIKKERAAEEARKVRGGKRVRPFSRARKSPRILQNKVRKNVDPVQLTLFVNMLVAFKKMHIYMLYLDTPLLCNSMYW